MSYQSCGFAVSTLGFVHFDLTISKIKCLNYLSKLDFTLHCINTRRFMDILVAMQFASKLIEVGKSSTGSHKLV